LTRAAHFSQTFGNRSPSPQFKERLHVEHHAVKTRLGARIGRALGAATLANEQFGGMRGNPPQARREFTQKEVKADALVETCNDLSKQNWEIFQIIPSRWQISPHGHYVKREREYPDRL
jgi:hypothetical protein